MSNAQDWRFLRIDEAGVLWATSATPFTLPLEYGSYDEDKVLTIYRWVRYCIKMCRDSYTPPPSQNVSTANISGTN